MPFTPSHAVVALPFLRTPLVPAAIAVGAMTPDVPLFLRGLPLPYRLTHDLAWLPVTAALALVLLILWRCVLRPAVRELSPTWLARRLPDEWDAGPAAALHETFAIVGTPARTSVRGILVLLVSLAIGVLSHVLWDLFTHEGRAGVEAIPALDEQWGPLTGYKWLQHGSSGFGLIVLAIWAIVWLRRRDPAPAVPRLLPTWVRWGWWLALPVILLVAWAIGLALFGPLRPEWTGADLGYRVLPSACALWGALTIVLAVAVQTIRRRSDPSSAASGVTPTAARRGPTDAGE